MASLLVIFRQPTMADFDLDLQYHPGKVNVVLDALSRKPSYMILSQQRELWAEFERLNLEVVLPESAGQCMSLQVELLSLIRLQRGRQAM